MCPFRLRRLDIQRNPTRGTTHWGKRIPAENDPHSLGTGRRSSVPHQLSKIIHAEGANRQLSPLIHVYLEGYIHDTYQQYMTTDKHGRNSTNEFPQQRNAKWWTQVKAMPCTAREDKSTARCTIQLVTLTDTTLSSTMSTKERNGKTAS